MIKFSTILSAVLLWSSAAFANGLALSNMSLVSQNTGTHTEDVQFDITWNNSWYISGAPAANANWDAAWVFVKYSVWNAGSSSWGAWSHCTLSKTNGDHTAPAGSQIAVGCSPSQACGGGDTAKGAFIYRNAAGTGTLSLSGAKLHWLYGTDGVNDTDKVRIQAFGIEMVYIPQASFYVGDGSSTGSGNFTDGSWSSGATIPVQITSEGAITMGTSAGNLWGTSPSGYNSIGSAGSLAAAFPKGYAAFYMMKYDVSQRQYVDFLNTLTRSQQNSRTASQTASQYAMSATANVNYRSGIRNPSSIPAGVITFGCDLQAITANNTTAGNGIFNESADGLWVAANYVSYMDQTAYAAWAGLRPFTELEFEKAARGPSAPVSNEYAWGTTNITPATGISNSGQTGEVASNGGANCAEAANVLGPVRVGEFAGAATTREQAGASYYGVMDLSGNLWKRPVTVGNATGRAFTGTHGSGVLSSNGNATNSNWPGISAGEVTGATGAGFRGGAWIGASTYARVSDRSLAAYDDAVRYYSYGARCARTSP